MSQAASVSTPRRGAHLLDAAVDLLAAGGDAALSVRTLARAAGVSPGQVQYYFRSRAELVEAAFEHASDEFVADVRTAIEQAAPGGRLVAAVWRWVPLDALRERRVRVWLAYVSATAADPGLRERAAALDDDLRRWFAAEIAEITGTSETPGTTATAETVATAGIGATDRPTAAAAELLAVVDGVSVQTLAVAGADREAFARSVLDPWFARLGVAG